MFDSKHVDKERDHFVGPEIPEIQLPYPPAVVQGGRPALYGYSASFGGDYKIKDAQPEEFRHRQPDESEA
jgi:hypothetical protein